MYPDNLELLECRKREILGQLEKVENQIADFKCKEVLRKEAYKEKEYKIKSVISYIEDRVIFNYTEYPKDKFITIDAFVSYNDKTFRQILNSTLVEKDKFRFFSTGGSNVCELSYDNIVNPGIKYSSVDNVCTKLIESTKKILIRRLASMIVMDSEKSSD